MGCQSARYDNGDYMGENKRKGVDTCADCSGAADGLELEGHHQRWALQAQQTEHSRLTQMGI